jgi:hypothetical protein
VAGDLTDGQRLRARGRQLDRQGDAVEAATHLRDRDDGVGVTIW